MESLAIIAVLYTFCKEKANDETILQVKQTLVCKFQDNGYLLEIYFHCSLADELLIFKKNSPNKGFKAKSNYEYVRTCIEALYEPLFADTALELGCKLALPVNYFTYCLNYKV